MRSLLERVDALRTSRPGITWENMAIELDYSSGEALRSAWRRESGGATRVSKANNIEIQDNGNTRVYTTEGNRIKTLDHLVDQCEIDLDAWIIDRHIVNKWDTIMKIPVEGDTWDVAIEENYQVKAWMLPKCPETITPAISPISIKTGYIRHKSKKIDTGRCVVVADPHFGFNKNVHTGELETFHDRFALTATLALIDSLDVDVIVIVGDILDLAEWSDKFIRSPEMYNTTQPAIVEAAWFFSQLREIAPDADIYYLEGNHEARMTRAINKQIPAAYGLTRPHSDLPVLSVPNLLGLDQIGIEYIGDYPKGEVWISENLRAVHGSVVRAKSGATATAVLDAGTQASTLFGHVHRRELASRTLVDHNGPRTISAFCPGCLCKIDGTVPGRGVPNWQNGLGVVDFDPTFVAITPVPIEQGVAMYNGSCYEGWDYVDRLRADTDFTF